MEKHLVAALTCEELALIRESLNNQLREEINGIANAGAGDYCNRLIRKANQLLDLIEVFSTQTADIYLKEEQ